MKKKTLIGIIAGVVVLPLTACAIIIAVIIKIRVR